MYVKVKLVQHEVSTKFQFRVRKYTQNAKKKKIYRNRIEWNRADKFVIQMNRNGNP